MRMLLGVIFVVLLIRTGFGDCNDASIAHPKSIFIEVNLSGSIVGPPFAPEDLQAAEGKVVEHVIESLMLERRNLRLPWEFKPAEGDELPRIVITVKDWSMSVELKYEENDQSVTLSTLPSKELVSPTEIDAGTFPAPNERLSFVAKKFVETYMHPNSTETTVNSFAIRPALWERLPVTEGILSPDPGRISETVPPSRFSLILLSFECYDAFAAEAFIWKCKRKPSLGTGRVMSSSKGQDFSLHYQMNGVAKQCLVVVHDAFPDPQIVEDRAEVFLSKTQSDPMDSSGGFLIAVN